MMSNGLVTKVVAVYLVGLSFAGTSVLAQDEALERLLKCGEIKSSADKLKCFEALVELAKKEKEVSAQSKKAETKPLTRADKKPAPKTTPAPAPTPAPNPAPIATEKFGFTEEEYQKSKEVEAEKASPKKASSKKKKKPAKINSIESEFVHYWKNNAGRHFFLLKNGQLWKTRGRSNIHFSKHARSIRIKKSAFGNYLGYIKGSIDPLRLKRVR